ncbi:MAG: tetratricopeptide repeat protein [Phycisphaerales bacterium]
MPNQDRSNTAMTQLHALLNEDGRLINVQPVAVVSGHEAGVVLLPLAEAQTWLARRGRPRLQSPGLMTVRVWPTTVIIDAAGKQVAHPPGLRESYTKDLHAYLDFAAGTIDEQTLNKQLDTNGSIASTPDNIAARHLHLAEKLLEKGQTRLAHDELERGMQVDPNDVPLRLTLARVRLMLGEPAEALTVLDALTPDDAPAWRTQTLRGRALVALDRYDEARAALTEALKINPDPAEALYFLARVHEHAGEWQQAAGAYRHAYEKARPANHLLNSNRLIQENRASMVI